DIRATFFIVGEVIDAHPDLVREIAAQGHEIGCHTYSHRPLWELDAESFAVELEQFATALARHLPGVRVQGFRAPTFSLNPATAWALPVLTQFGYTYDSSVFPLKTPLYGVPGCPAQPYHPAANLVDHDPNTALCEWPLTAWRIGPLTIPVCGGFYLRALPFPLILQGLRSAQRKGPIVVYVHPWELDEDLPRLPLRAQDRFITYYNVGRPLRRRLLKLLDSFSFGRMIDVLEEYEVVSRNC
ncbi:MAG: DUF3473 domain-containing protein, partial [Chloroflexi bacterium]|nr:DUF3473 domain-containing protein [Chloroflexota bacterium]